MRILDEAAFLFAVLVFCCCVVLLKSCMTQQKSKVLLKQFDLVRRPVFPFPSARLKTTTTTRLTAATPITTTFVVSSPGRASASSTSSVVSSVPTTPTSPLPSTATASPTPMSTAPSVTRAPAELARDCGDVDLSSTISGTAVQRATVFRPGCLNARSCALNVSCDTSTDGGGWTIIQQRLNDDVSFFRTWREYRDGFGDESNFWIGNEYLFELTNSRPSRIGVGAVKRDVYLFVLSVSLTDFNNTSYISTYDNFKIDSEANNYTLTLRKTSGTQANCLASSSDARPFGTFDAGADGSQRCALTTRSGWWHPKFCSHPAIGNLNAKYSELYWSNGAAATKPFRIKEVQLKLRRKVATETVI